jgi:chromosomal replication initiator protein
LSSLEVWSEVQRRVEREIGSEAFNIWFERLKLGAISDGNVELRAPDPYHLDWVRWNYEGILTSQFSEVMGRQVRLSFAVDSRSADPAAPRIEVSEEPSREDSPRTTGLMTSKIFDNFVVGACNQFAHAASLAVADFPGSPNYNPLFIYGGTGLGNTHLIHAIGNRVLHQNRGAKLVYTTAEAFVNEMINAIRFKRMEAFRTRFREEGTVLLIDDIQFLGGKDRSQEEFFYTFQAFHTTGRQIVVTADALPKEIQKLEPRLRTRFEGGLLADIQPPDLETMVAILRKKADEMGIDVPADLAGWIAPRVRGNIRELEGILNRLAALADFYSAPLTMEFARQHLGPQFADPVEAITPDRIMEVVARFFNIKVADLKGKRRVKSIARPRQLSMYLSRKHTQLSYPDLGRAFGGRDHSTVHHADKKIHSELEKDADLRHLIQTLEQNLGL